MDKQKFVDEKKIALLSVEKNKRYLNSDTAFVENKKNSNNEIDVGKSLQSFRKSVLGEEATLAEKAGAVKADGTGLGTLNLQNKNPTFNFKSSEKFSESDVVVSNVDMAGLVNRQKNEMPITAGNVINENNELKMGGLNKLNNSLKNLGILKFFSNKNNKVAAMVVVFAILLVLILNLGSFSASTSQNKNPTPGSAEYVSSRNYIENIQLSLEKVLSNIHGAGKVTVMVTLESGPELKIASSIDERTTTTKTGSDSATTNVNIVKNPIIITQNGGSNPLVLMEITPVIKGVIVVAQGANNTKVKLQLLQAVQSLLKVDNDSIQIYAGI